MSKNNKNQKLKPSPVAGIQKKSVTTVAKSNNLSTKSSRKTSKKLESGKNKAYSGISLKPKANKIARSESVTKWLRPTSGKTVRRFSSAENGNKGIDIIGKRGQAIYAAADGKVVYAGSALRGYGKLLIIKHNDDYLSAYAHNHKFHVKEQDRVSAGQRIADMGATDAPLDMLHFEIRYRGKSVNPEKFLPK